MGAKCCVQENEPQLQDIVTIPSLSVRDGATLHPVQTTLENELESVFFIRASSFLQTAVPYQRRQDAGLDPQVAEDSDVVICISHAWPYQIHPDPTTEKVDVINGLLKQACSGMPGDADPLLFFDYLSVTQRPRSATEEQLFKAALEAMPLIYLRADSVIHIDQQVGRIATDGKEVTVPATSLRSIELRGVRDIVQLCATPPGQTLAKENDTVVSVDGKKVLSVDHAKQLLQSGTTVCICKSEYGLRNDVPPGQRGWIFLERFASMVKVAMVKDEHRKKVVYSNNPKVVEEIHAGGEKLRAAAEKGSLELRKVLAVFAEELKTKSFSGTSTDRLQLVDSTSDAFSEEAKAVLAVMDQAITYLQLHWMEEREKQTKRMLTDRLRRMSENHQAAAIQGLRDSDDAVVLTYFPLIGRGEYIILICIEHDIPMRMPEFTGDFGPTGTVPNMKHCGLELWDSCAIVQYLLEKFPGPSVPLPKDRYKALDWWAVLQDYYSYVLSPLHDIIMKLPKRNLRLTDACRVCGAASSDMNGTITMQSKLIDLHIQRTTYMEKVLQDAGSPQYLCGNFTYVDLMLYTFVTAIDKCKGFQDFRDAVKDATKSGDCLAHCPILRGICNRVAKRPAVAVREHRYAPCDI